MNKYIQFLNMYKILLTLLNSWIVEEVFNIPLMDYLLGKDED